ncbi:MAG TPA: hypothetical protein VHP99_02125 [Pyrinomonadaceae bacterium]|nr:hypothetical protein [Pyrinomonadaceae bacterium]
MSVMSGDVVGICAIPGIGVGVADGADFFAASPLDFMPVMSGVGVGLCAIAPGVGVGIGIFIGV